MTDVFPQRFFGFQWTSKYLLKRYFVGMFGEGCLDVESSYFFTGIGMLKNMARHFKSASRVQRHVPSQTEGIIFQYFPTRGSMEVSN